MAEKEPFKKIVQSGLQRRLALALAGASSGARLLGSHTESLFKSTEQQARIRSEALAREATRFTDKLGELKGAYVKIGQMMAMYGEHFLPKEVTHALHGLEHNTQPLAWSSIKPLLRENLADAEQELKIDTTPLAAASLSQVHRAMDLNTTDELVLKVQYPGVVETISADFDTVLTMLRFARWLPNGKEVEGWLADLKLMLLDEVDYCREAKMTARIANLLASDDRYRIPKIALQYSTQKVLAMEYLPGEAVTSDKVAKLSLARKNALAYAMLEYFFYEVFEWGVMQTDPNFGNYRIQLREGVNDIDRLILLDFGAVRELDTSLQVSLKQTILAAHCGDDDGVVNGLMALGCLTENQSKQAHDSFIEFCFLLMEPFRRDHGETPTFALNKKGTYHWNESRLLRRVGKVGANAMMMEGFTPPPKEFALIARKLTGVFTFITTIGAQFDARPIIEKYI